MKTMGPDPLKRVAAVRLRPVALRAFASRSKKSKACSGLVTTLRAVIDPMIDPASAEGDRVPEPVR